MNKWKQRSEDWCKQPLNYNFNRTFFLLSKILLLLITILLFMLLFIISMLGWETTDIIYFAVGIVVSGGLIGICGCILILMLEGAKK